MEDVGLDMGRGRQIGKPLAIDLVDLVPQRRFSTGESPGGRP